MTLPPEHVVVVNDVCTVFSLSEFEARISYVTTPLLTAASLDQYSIGVDTGRQKRCLQGFYSSCGLQGDMPKVRLGSHRPKMSLLQPFHQFHAAILLLAGIGGIATDRRIRANALGLQARCGDLVDCHQFSDNGERALV